ncbi:MAG TPA: translation initiation factor IF-2 [Acetomicrobium flavidum]|uniref:Translation initiation factor IF-2 n=3 Tax=Acetomicrobium flavidum TaxID=49896 RepID=A0ABY1JAR3_9BACT|nr:bacterial translation initiation factor 2 (bIF-2) [Acetomicrobium flavidum]HOJ82642.1 translation initiation factor IF-2 [Acetomicrobium flavidum]HOM31573.1 translation initiation factor IF-2 [Acetomicrobium flavidum]HPP14765.1 translation initiation factor IF-2 [Acetomicrobium flavidum]
MGKRKIRIYELAKMLNIDNKDLLQIIQDLGVEAKSHMSSIDTDVAQIIEETLREEKESKLGKRSEEVATTLDTLEISEGSTVEDVANRLGKPATTLVKELISAGFMVPANAVINEDIAKTINKVLGVNVKIVPASAETKDEPRVRTVEPKKHEKPKNLLPRPPIVTVMGHVDHGKTTLLDYIRKTNVTAREFGGITQHIGASVVEHNGKKIVFLDTPGHEAFTSMRARGAQVTDIVVLIVAADDGVMPQTIEALNHAKAANTPIIVAINKIDKPSAKPDRVKQQLADLGLIPEEWGGDTIMVEISAKTGLNVDQLLEMILLVAEMNELVADYEATPQGVVIEAELDKGKGPVANVIVQQGTLRRGDILLFETTWGRVRAMMDHLGRNVDEVTPSLPAKILGLEDVPQAGERFIKVDDERAAREAVEQYMEKKRQQEMQAVKRTSLEELFEQMEKGEKPVVRMILKSDVQGTLEAIKSSLMRLAVEEVGIEVVHEGVGRITESDVMLADASNAIIIGFNVRPDGNAKKLAEQKGIQIRLYRTIYDVIDDVKAAVEGMLAPKLKEQILGEAEVRAVFKVPKVGQIAGCYVREGVIKRNAKARVIRDGVVIWEGSLLSLKRFKDDVREVNAGYECGIGLAGFQDLREGDIIEAFEVVEEKRHLSDVS